MGLGVRRFYDGAVVAAAAAGREWAESGVGTAVALGDLVDRRVKDPGEPLAAVLLALRGGGASSLMATVESACCCEDGGLFSDSRLSLGLLNQTK